MPSYLDRHLQIILQSDTASSRFWRELSSERRKTLTNIWREIDAFCPNQRKDLMSAHLQIHESTKRWFVRVQEREFQYSRIRDDWPIIVRDADAKRQLLAQSQARLRRLVRIYQRRSGNSQGEHRIHLYGGIKPDGSIDPKLFQDRPGNAIQRNEVDLWDIVRFRIVMPGLDDLLTISVLFWEAFFDDVLKCRNYYYRPRNDYVRDAYRAIHFELGDREGNPIEVQIVTCYREAVSFLDHSFTFKRILPFLGPEHMQWLSDFSTKANLLDAFRSQGPNLSLARAHL